MEAVPVCAQRGDASTKRPKPATIADAATTLHPVIADEVAVLIVLVNRETSLCSIMRNSSFQGGLGFRWSVQSGTKRAQRNQTRRIEASLLHEGVKFGHRLPRWMARSMPRKLWNSCVGYHCDQTLR